MYVTAFNTSSAPVTVDAEGRQIGGWDWGTVNTTADLASDAIKAGTLVVVEVPDDGHPDAVAARDRTVRVAERFTQFDALDKEQLVGVAVEAEIPGAEDAYKRDLAHALAARLEVEVPDPPAAEAATAEVPGEPVVPEPVEPASPESPPGPVTPETPGDASVKQTSRRRAGRE